ncbi:hypothetical protein [Streptomyces sp. NBC_01465]|uniref:hypothetical protein n=1 Tax=Streptomyces sp. NBC_01465 TaxID=2903878 RepID=UPI002E3180DF|nr:hypothetical protein [Streptomyces sp. NBC_01465]
MAQNSGWGGAYGGPPGYGGAPGWGGWQPPPQAPKPGVIPLRPLAVGDMLNGTMTTIGRYWKPLIGIAVTLYGGAAILVGAFIGILYATFSDTVDTVFHTTDDDLGWSDVRSLVFGFIALWVVAMLLVVFCTAMMYATCAVVLQQAVLGRPATYKSVWWSALSRVPAVLGAVLLSGLATVVPILLIAAVFTALIVAVVNNDSSPALFALIPLLVLTVIPLAAWLWVKFSLAPSAVVFEGRRPVAALRRSSELVKGSWWRIFGISLLAFAMAAAAGYLIQLPFSLLGSFPTATLGDDPGTAQIVAVFSGYLAAVLVGQLVSQIITVTVPQLMTGMLYVDQRFRKEDLAPVLARAATEA